MTYHDAVHRFGIQAALPWYEKFREQVLAYDTLRWGRRGLSRGV